MISELARFYRIHPEGMIGICVLTGEQCDTFENQNHDCRRCNTPIYVGMTDEGRRRLQKHIFPKVVDDGEDVLKPCPFCGGKATIVRDYPPSKKPAMDNEWVECTKCGSTGRYHRITRSHSAVIRDWNRRVSE